MSSLSGSGSGSNSGSSQARVGEKSSAQRADYLTNQKGDAIGSNYVVPKGDFANFMGYRPPTADEANGTVKTDSRRAMELSMQKELQEIGLGAAKNGNAYRNQYVAGEQYANQLGHERDAIKDMRDAIAQSADKNSMESRSLQMGSGTAQYFAKVENMQKQSHNDNVRYLEMQYKFQEISKQDSTISNLMKVRHDAVSRTIRGGQS
jgi:hypothetical protein